MPKWKGKKVSKARYFHLRRSVENRIATDADNWGFNYKQKPFVIGGKKNSKHIRKNCFNKSSN